MTDVSEFNVPIAQRIKWFQSMNVARPLPDPFWVTEELITKLYEYGEQYIHIFDLREILAKLGTTRPSSSELPDGRPIEHSIILHLTDDFKNYCCCEDGMLNTMIFIEHWIRMDVFTSMRKCKSIYGSEIPLQHIILAFYGSAGLFRGHRMLQSLIHETTQGFVPLYELCKFYFVHEAKVNKEAVEIGITNVKLGPLAKMDLEKELIEAIKEDCFTQVQMLVSKAGVDIRKAKDETGTSAVDLVTEQKFPEVYKYFQSIKEGGATGS